MSPAFEGRITFGGTASIELRDRARLCGEIAEVAEELACLIEALGDLSSSERIEAGKLFNSLARELQISARVEYY